MQLLPFRGKSWFLLAVPLPLSGHKFISVNSRLSLSEQPPFPNDFPTWRGAGEGPFIKICQQHQPMGNTCLQLVSVPNFKWTIALPTSPQTQGLMQVISTQDLSSFTFSKYKFQQCAHTISLWHLLVCFRTQILTLTTPFQPLAPNFYSSPPLICLGLFSKP